MVWAHKLVRALVREQARHHGATCCFRPTAAGAPSWTRLRCDNSRPNDTTTLPHERPAIPDIRTIPLTSATDTVPTQENTPKKKQHPTPSSKPTPPRKGQRCPPKQQQPPPTQRLQFRDEWLPCREHLDPQGKLLPTSSWVHVDGTLPLTTLEELLWSMEQILFEELSSGAGVVDLDAPWNPLQDQSVPTVPMTVVVEEENHDHDEPTDQDVVDDIGNVNLPATRRQPFHVRAAHVVLSPFGRPTGWHLKLANPSMASALIVRAASERRVRVAWKMVQVHEYHYPTSDHEVTKSRNHINGLPVDDTMVRFENCHRSLDEEHLRLLLSRYELARTGGPTILKWKGITSDGKGQLMFVVRFLDASWARAAVREKQGLDIAGKDLRLIQYPKQLLLDKED